MSDNYNSGSVFDSLGNYYVIGGEIGGTITYLLKYDFQNNQTWTKQFIPDTSLYSRTIDAITIDGFDNVYVLFNEVDYNIDPIQYHGFNVVKLNSSGTILNQFNLYGIWYPTQISDVKATSLSVDSQGNIIIAGSTKQDNFQNSTYSFISKYDGISGNQLWNKIIGEGLGNYNINIYGVVVNQSNTIFACGDYQTITNGSLNFNNSPILLSYTGTGNFLWLKQTGDSGSNYDITSDSENNIYVLGGFNNSGSLLKYGQNGFDIWKRQFDLSSKYPSIPLTTIKCFGVCEKNSNVFIVGTASETMEANGNTYIVSANYDSDGNLQWSRQFRTNYPNYILNTNVSNGKKSISVSQDSFSYCMTTEVTKSVYSVSLSSNTFMGMSIKLPTDGSLIGSYGLFDYTNSDVSNSEITQTTTDLVFFSESVSSNLSSNVSKTISTLDYIIDYSSIINPIQ